VAGVSGTPACTQGFVWVALVAHIRALRIERSARVGSTLPPSTGEILAEGSDGQVDFILYIHRSLHSLSRCRQHKVWTECPLEQT
jgi:hypothetical protein